MATESNDPSSDDLDIRPLADAVRAMWCGQRDAVLAVETALPRIAAAAEAAAQALTRGGRLVYAGAGTSARIAVQDGAELFPTFGWPRERIGFAVAGGTSALDRSVEGAEDDSVVGAQAIAGLIAGPDDVLVAVSASGATPFTLAALKAADALGAATVAVASNADAPMLLVARYPIAVESGSEVIAGSTRMNAGTAQKVVLNLLSSAIMVRLGHVYGGHMVGMRPTNAKLRARAVRIVGRIAGCGETVAAGALSAADDDIRVAALVASGKGLVEARQTLERHGWNLRAARRALGLEKP